MLIACCADGTFAIYSYNPDLKISAWTRQKVVGNAWSKTAATVLDKYSDGDVIYFNVVRKVKNCTK